MNISSTSTGSSTDYSRITGLATGLDVDGLVKSALAGEQSKIDKVDQDRQSLQWQQEAYVDVIKDLKEFYNYFDVLKSDNMMLSTAYSGVVASSSNENVVTATALPGAVKGSYGITVNQLAQGAKAQSAQLTSGGVKATGATVLTSLSTSVTSGNFDITVAGKTFNVSVDATKTINDLVSTIKNETLNGEVLGNYVNVSFSELTGKLTIETKSTGASQNLTISNITTDSNIQTLFGGPVVAPGVAPAAIQDDGQDASVSITAPGETVAATVTKSSNNFTIDNMTYNLASTGTTTITTKADASDQVDKFKKFIEKYNTLVEKINTKINEKKEYSYKPLTDAQKDEMKDDEIKNWETAAKKGILRRESNLTNLLSEMRSALYTAVDGAGVSLSEIGISTTSNYMDGGKLTLDETKLKSALEEKGDLVQKLFTQSGTIDSEKGIFQRIKTSIDDLVGQEGILIKKAGYTDSRWLISNDLSKKIEEKNNKIQEMQNMMATKQQNLYSMYAVLEKNMNNLNAQSSWLASSLGSM